MKYIKFFLFFIFLSLAFPLSATAFKGVQITEVGETEAYFKNDSDSSEFCCDREYTGGWAQESSPQERQRMINRFLFTDYKSSRPPTKKPPAKGQR